MWVSRFDDVYAQSLIGQDLTLAELGDLITRTTAPAKDKLPILKLGRFGAVRTAQNSLRHDQNLQSVSGIEGDYDGQQMPFTEAVDRLETAGISFVAHTTPRHTAAQPRWRILCPLSREYPPGDRARFVNWLNGALGGVLGREAWVASQSFYFGSVTGVPFEFHLGDTSELCIDEVDDLEATAQPFRPAAGAAGGKSAPGDYASMQDWELLDVIKSGAHYWGPAKHLLTLWARAGVDKATAEADLAAAFDAVAARDKKWQKNRGNIGRWVRDVYARALKKQGTASFTQVVAALENEPQWQGAIRRNDFTEGLEVCTPFPPQPGQTPAFHRAIRDPDDLLELWAALQASGFPKVRKTTVWDALSLVAARNGFHPVRRWLNGLTWDGEERLGKLFLTYFPGEVPQPADAAEKQKWDQIRQFGQELPPDDQVIAYYERTAACFLVGAVARVMRPGVKVDTLPCIISPQGFDKSKGLQALVPDPSWFSDDVSTNVGERDAKESLSGKLLLELSEFPHAKRDIDKVKAFFSRQVDRFRHAYGRANVDHPRQCVFAATSNGLEFIDVTGNRRIWPIPLAGRVDVARIERDRDQLWAEANHWHDDGYQWWLPPGIEAIAGAMQDQYIEEDGWDDQILDWVHTYHVKQDAAGTPVRDPAGNFTYMPFTRKAALQGIGLTYLAGEKNTVTRSDEMRMSRRLRRLGFRPDPHRARGTSRERFWIPVQKSTL